LNWFHSLNTPGNCKQFNSTPITNWQWWWYLGCWWQNTDPSGRL